MDMMVGIEGNRHGSRAIALSFNWIAVSPNSARIRFTSR
jgi:hypothetical protein